MHTHQYIFWHFLCFTKDLNNITTITSHDQSMSSTSLPYQPLLTTFSNLLISCCKLISFTGLNNSGKATLKNLCIRGSHNCIHLLVKTLSSQIFLCLIRVGSRMIDPPKTDHSIGNSRVLKWDITSIVTVSFPCYT